MKKILLIVLLVMSVCEKSSGQSLCVPCSKSMGSGVEFPTTLSGQMTLFSAVGFNAVGDYLATDSSRLISGYMLVCVLPIVGAGADTIVCSGDTVNFTAGAYLTDTIKWESPKIGKVSKFYFKTVEDPLFQNVTNKKPDVYIDTIRVYSKKGIITSDSDVVLYKVVPKPIPIVRGGKIPIAICRNASLVIGAIDSIFPNNDGVTFDWNYSSINGLSGSDSTNTLNLSGFSKDSIKVTLVVKNKYFGLTVDFQNDVVPCAVDTTIFWLNTIDPEAEVSISAEKTGINPADYEDQLKQFKLLLKVLPGSNYDAALLSCPPDSISAEIEVNAEHFYPKSNPPDIITNSVNNSFKITVNGKLKNNGSSSGNLYEIEGTPMLGSSVTSIIALKNVKFSGAGISNSTYDLIAKGGTLDFLTCNEGVNGDRLLFKKIGTLTASIYPNPISTDKCTIVFSNDQKNHTETIGLELLTMVGTTLGGKHELTVKDGTEYDMDMPKNLLTGYYLLKITRASGYDVVPIIIHR